MEEESANVTETNQSKEEMGIKVDRSPSRLTIKTVWDIRQGKEVDAEELIKQPEGELISLRRQLQIAISTNTPLLVCPYCHQMVRLSGRKIKRGAVSFFSHLYDSDACFIKTTTGMSKEQIEASKYGLVAESERHKRLKALIAESLQSKTSREKGLDQVLVEKRINSPLPYLKWRCPDVQAKFNQLNLVFELQLSTTFISTIVDRDIFYRLNNYFIIWVFNFEDNQEYVNLENLMCKDIYYANKRNVFIFDQEAQLESLKKGELILTCNWLDLDNTWHYPLNKNGKNGVLVSLDQLQYDLETNKPFYYDADADYFKLHPEAVENRLRWEMTREEIIRALMEKDAKENDLYEGQSESLRDETRQKMAIHGDCAHTFSKHGRVGLSFDGVILVPPVFSSISEFNDYGYAEVSHNRHIGLVDKLGNTIIQCEANEIVFLRSDIILYRKNPYWYIVGIKNPIISSGYFSPSLSCVNDHVDHIRFGGYSERHVYLLFENRIIIQEVNKDEFCIYDFSGAEIISSNDPIINIDFKDELIFISYKDPRKFMYDSGYGYYHKTYFGIYNYSIKEILAPQRRQTIKEGLIGQIIVNTEYQPHSGVLSGDGEIIVPFQYGKIEPWNNTLYKVRKDYYSKHTVRGVGRMLSQQYESLSSSFWGLVSNSGEVVLPFEYKEIDNPDNNDCFIVNKGGKKGVMNLVFNTVIACEYDDIQQVENCFIVKKAGKYGAIVSQFDIQIPCEYDEIHPWGNSLFVVTIIDGFRKETIMDHHSLRGRMKTITVMNKYYFLIKADNSRIDNRNYLTVSSLKDNKAKACTIDNVEVILDADGQVIG